MRSVLLKLIITHLEREHAPHLICESGFDIEVGGDGLRPGCYTYILIDVLCGG